MSDMYGAVRSNWFKVKDPAEFRDWFEANVWFGYEVELWIGRDPANPHLVAFGGYEQYPSAYPRRLFDVDDDDADEPDTWGLDEFAAEIRKRLQDGEEFRVLAAGNEKLRYVSATHLIITATKATFSEYYEGN